MKKILIYIIALLLLAGCSQKKESKIEDNKNSVRSDDLSAVLKNKELFDWDIIDDKFYILYGDEEASLLGYDLKDNKILFDKVINQKFYPHTKLIPLQNGYVVEKGKTVMDIYNYNDELLHTIDLNNYLDEDLFSPSFAVSQDLEKVVFTNNQKVYLIDIKSNSVSNILTLNANLNSLVSIQELTFLDNQTVCYIGDTILKEDEQSTPCYGTIDLNLHTYTKTNSSAVTLDNYKNNVLIHNAFVPMDEIKESTSYLYEGTLAKDLKLSKKDSVNVHVLNEGIAIIDSGSKGDWRPNLKFNEKDYGDFGYSYISMAAKYQNRIFLYGYLDNEDEKTSFMVQEVN